MIASSKNTSTVPPKPGAKAPASDSKPVAGSTGHPNSNAVVAGGNSTSEKPSPVAVAARDSVPLFGGHRGGGKKREDGLPAGSPEAKEADRKKAADRQATRRERIKLASLPPPLPSAPPPDANAPAVVAGDAPAVPGAVAGAPVVAAGFVGWQQKLLEKPAKLITKIADRFRCWQLTKKVKQLKLSPDVEKEILADLKWKDEVVADFNGSLAECAAMELNRRRVPGAQNSHWINLAMCAGEMVLVHLQTLDRLEKLVADDRAKSAPEKKT